MAKIASVRRALTLSFVSTYTSLAFNLATVMVVSRLLTPEEIGVFSVAMGLTALVQMLRTLGVGEYLVQAPEVDRETVRTAFTVNLAISWLLALGLYLISGVIGRFYGDPGVAKVIAVLSLSFMVSPFGVTRIAQLRRELAFGTLYKIKIGEVTVRSGMTIGLVFAGFSYMSMAWAALAATAASVVGCSVWGRRYPVGGLSVSRWRQVLPFGVKRTFADLAAQLGEQSANVVIGKMLGLAAAGYYSRGYSLLNIYRKKVVRAINSVAFPAFAREHREKQSAPELFRHSLVLFTGVSWPFLAFSVLMGGAIIRLFFGPQWAASVPVLQWLCGAGILATMVYQCNAFFTGVGRIGVVTSTVSVYQVARVGLAVAASLYSIEAVAASQVLVYAAAIVLYYRQLTRYEALSLGKLLTALWRSAVVTVASCAAPAIVAVWWAGELQQHYLMALAIAVPGAGIGWLISVILTRHPLLRELQYLKTAWMRRFSFSNS